MAGTKWCERCAAARTSDNMPTVAFDFSYSLPQFFKVDYCGLVHPTEQLFLLVCTGYLYLSVLENRNV